VVNLTVLYDSKTTLFIYQYIYNQKSKIKNCGSTPIRNPKKCTFVENLTILDHINKIIK
jgi:hypothetical protein